MTNDSMLKNSVPTPKGGPLNRHTRPAVLIGMIHVPISNILMGTDSCLCQFDLPVPVRADNMIWRELVRQYDDVRGNSVIPEYQDAYSGVLLTPDFNDRFRDAVNRLSFMPYLVERALREVEVYVRHGIQVLQMENIGAPYAPPPSLPVLEELVMENVTRCIREAHPNLAMGIQMLSCGENVALQIAIKHGLFYVRGESLVYSGQRPDGSVNASGRLKKAYMMRSYFNREAGLANEFPVIYPDILKKHTVFPSELQNLDLWLENCDFLKLEGLILTGPTTSSPVDKSRLEHVRLFMDQIDTRIPLIIGSGVTSVNIKEYFAVANAIIVGSSIKHNRDWEQPLCERYLVDLVKAYGRCTI